MSIRAFRNYYLHESAYFRQDGYKCENYMQLAQEVGAFISPDQLRKFEIIDLHSPLNIVIKNRQFPELNKLLLEIREANQFIQENYEIEGNVPYIQDAEIVCIGEYHFPYNQRINGKAISLLGKVDRDIIFVEAPSGFTYLKTGQTKYVTGDFPTFGWDWDQRFDPAPFFKASILALGLFGCALYLNHHRVISNSKLQNLMLISGWLRVYAISRLAQEFPRRNQQMCTMMDEHSHNKRKLFMIAGKGHLTSGWRENLFGYASSWLFGKGVTNPVKNAIEIVRTHLKTKKWVVLIPKRGLFRSMIGF